MDGGATATMRPRMNRDAGRRLYYETAEEPSSGTLPGFRETLQSHDTWDARKEKARFDELHRALEWSVKDIEDLGEPVGGFEVQSFKARRGGAGPAGDAWGRVVGGAE